MTINKCLFFINWRKYFILNKILCFRNIYFILEPRNMPLLYRVSAKIHHHEHPGLGHLARSLSRVTVALSIVSSVSQLFSFLVGCSEMILKGFGFVAFFASVKASSFCIHLQKFKLFYKVRQILRICRSL
jgi:hypothetical protein